MRIRSGEFDILEMYALYRFSCTYGRAWPIPGLQFNFKGIAVSKCTGAKKNFRFSLLFLAHIDFKKQPVSRLRKIMMRSKRIGYSFFVCLPIESVKLLFSLFKIFCTLIAIWNIAGRHQILTQYRAVVGPLRCPLQTCLLA